MLWAVPKPAVFHSVGVQAVKCSRAGIEEHGGGGADEEKSVNHGVRENASMWRQ